MKRIVQPTLFLGLLLTHVVCGQQTVELIEEKPLSNEDPVVCEAGNLIPQESAPVNQPRVAAPLPDIHFFEGFASESSEKALLDHVEKMLAKDPEHACEIVKEAITIAEAEVELVAKIVETACLAAPEKMRIIAQCAIATCPDALPLIQKVLAKLDPSTGLSADGKSGLEKGGLEKAGVEESEDMDNPLVPPNTPPPGSPPIPIDTPPPTLPPFPPTISPPPSTNNNR